MIAFIQNKSVSNEVIFLKFMYTYTYLVYLYKSYYRLKMYIILFSYLTFLLVINYGV